MAKSLGILVSSNKHLEKIIKLCTAAKSKNVKVTIFFTHEGVLLTQDSGFIELEGMAHMALCNVGFESHELKSPVPGIGEKDFGTQARHSGLIEECDRYVVF